MAEELRRSEIENVKFIFSILQGKPDQVDAIELPRILRSLNTNPSLERLKQLGMPERPGQKFFNTDEVIGIYATMKKELKDQGCYEDFIELLKLYDKNENGKMQLGELSHSLLALGEKLTDAEVDELFEDCMNEENDDGEIDYIPFLAAMCEVKKEKE